jgi:hypothetical protein
MISFDELIRMLRGSLNDRRLKAVGQVYKRLDKFNSGAVELQVLERAYQAQNHPKVRSGEQSID